MDNMGQQSSNSANNSDLDKSGGLLSNILKEAEEKISLGKDLIQKLDMYDVPGVPGVQKKILQEIKFLQKVERNHMLTLNHVQCSNLKYYEVLVKVLQLQKDVIHINRGFKIQDRGSPLKVDIISENGLKWIKVIARNSKSLTYVMRGESSYGTRTILDQAEEYVKIAAQNLYMFKCPKVIFYFSHHIDKKLSETLREQGVDVVYLEQCHEEQLSESYSINNISTVNLDVTTMLAYISNICNGSNNWTFAQAILTEQAKEEQKNPVKPILDKFFKDKRLICCNIAYKSFEKIVSIMAGPQERQRAADLLKRIEVLPDVTNVPDELLNVKYSGKINERSLKVFAFGLSMKAVTCTANKSFVESTKMQGCNIPVFIHQARALTEGKERTASHVCPPTGSF